MFQQDSSESALLQRVLAQCVSDSAKVEKPSTSAEKPFWSLPGFGAGARVATSFGHVPVEALRRRDAIKTRDGRFLEVQHVDKVRLDRRFLLTHPDAQPIAIPQGGLADAVPNQAILVSGFQNIRSPKRFDEVCSRLAVDYVGRSNIARKYHGYFTYYVFHCGERCTVNISGLWIDIDPDALKTSED